MDKYELRAIILSGILLSVFFFAVLYNSYSRFPFFNIFASGQMLKLQKNSRPKAVTIFEEILKEWDNHLDFTSVAITANMLKLFVLSSREVNSESPILTKTSYNSVLLKQFLNLIEENFKDVRLPKDYAALLYITSNHLNFICKDQINMSAGEIIRNRVLLEAKRMLVNFELSVATIGMELNFFDTSYFIKFFKKYTLFTPEAFRKQYYNKS